MGIESRKYYEHLDVDIISCDDFLPADGAYLDLDVHDTKRFSADVDLDKPWVHGLVEFSKARYKAHGTYAVKVIF